jgi:hypothetical protein
VTTRIWKNMKKFVISETQSCERNSH